MNGLVVNQKNRFGVDTSQPIEDALRTLLKIKPVWPDKEYLKSFIGVPLNGDEAVQREWHRRVWWGYYASRIVYQYVISGKTDDVSRIIVPVDTTMLDQALAKNKGVILAGNHLGPYPAMYTGLRQMGSLNLLTLTSNKERKSSDMLHVSSPEEQKLSLVKSLMHLRKNGILRIAPDGRVVGDSALFFNFMGKRVRLARGAAELVALSGAETLWCSATWASTTSIKIRMQPLDMPREAETKEQRIIEWYCEYLRKLERQMRSSPQDIGFRSGHLLAHRGRLKNYRSTP